jgi:sulfite reductase (ferredoxin)
LHHRAGWRGKLRHRLAAQYFTMDAAVKGLHIKMSGCFNSCGQHHISDIGFYGNSRTINNRKVPHFQVLLGGKWRTTPGSYGLAIGSVPSKNVPEVVERITQRFVKERQGNESFRISSRASARKSRKMLEDLMEVPPYEVEPSFYSDWGDPREFTMGDMGMGECAGEIVSRLISTCRRRNGLCFEAQLKLEAKRFGQGRRAGLQIDAAGGAGTGEGIVVRRSQRSDVIAKEFRARLFEPKAVLGPVCRRQVRAGLFPSARESAETIHDYDEVHRLIEESQLFIEAAHACSRQTAGTKGRRRQPIACL